MRIWAIALLLLTPVAAADLLTWSTDATREATSGNTCQETIRTSMLPAAGIEEGEIPIGVNPGGLACTLFASYTVPAAIVVEEPITLDIVMRCLLPSPGDPGPALLDWRAYLSVAGGGEVESNTVEDSTCTEEGEVIQVALPFAGTAGPLAAGDTLELRLQYWRTSGEGDAASAVFVVGDGFTGLRAAGLVPAAAPAGPVNTSEDMTTDSARQTWETPRNATTSYNWTAPWSGDTQVTFTTTDQAGTARLVSGDLDLTLTEAGSADGSITVTAGEVVQFHLELEDFTGTVAFQIEQVEHDPPEGDGGSAPDTPQGNTTTPDDGTSAQPGEKSPAPLWLVLAALALVRRR